MAFGEDRDQPFHADLPDGQLVCAGHREADQREVERPGVEHAEQLRGGVLAQVQAQTGQFCVGTAQQARQEVVAEAADEPEPELALVAARDPPDPVDGGGLCFEQPPGVFGERAAGRGEPCTTRAPVEQGDPQAALQPLDRLAERWLAHDEPLGGAAEVLLFGQHDELLEEALGQFHMAKHMRCGGRKYWTIWGAGDLTACQQTGVRAGPDEDRRHAMSSGRQEAGGGGPLSGVRVVELASVIMAPYAAQQLGDLGADVIKVEPPTGDMTRHYPPTRNPGMGAAALNLNRNKRSVAIDLKAPGGRDALLALIATADVFITNIRPQALRRLGLGPEDVAAVNSRLVHLNAQGFRSDSELGGHAAYDDIVQAASGLVWLNEQVSGVPYFVPTVVADKICGLVIVQSVLAALHHRDRTGQGQHIEVPMADTMLAFNLVEHLAAATLDPPQGPMGYSRALSSRRKAATTADGRMCILPYSDRNWRDFFTFVGRPELADDPRFGSLAERARNADELYALMEEFSPGTPAPHGRSSAIRPASRQPRC